MKALYEFDPSVRAIHQATESPAELATAIARYLPSIEVCDKLHQSYEPTRDRFVSKCNAWMKDRTPEIAAEIRSIASEFEFLKLT